MDRERFVLLQVRPNMGESAGNKERHSLIGEARRGVECPELDPRFRREARLLAQFSLGGLQGALARINVPGDELPHLCLDGGAELLDHDDLIAPLPCLARLLKRHDGNYGRVADHLPATRLPTFFRYLEEFHLDHLSVIDLTALGYFWHGYSF